MYSNPSNTEMIELQSERAWETKTAPIEHNRSQVSQHYVGLINEINRHWAQLAGLLGRVTVCWRVNHLGI